MSVFGGGEAGLELFHVGIVVPDVEAALETYSDAFGFHWTELRRSSPQEVMAGGQRVSTEIRACYSVEGPPHVELIEDVTGNVWGDSAYGLNHTGYWADDITTARDRLERSGLPAIVFDAGSTPPRFSYHRAANGMWVELVGPGFRPRLLERVRAAQERMPR
jgi:catechol 2,3-dioxygenase-like lactoylglutathione lyase family enzyme